jgi:hypothetical protein
MRIQAKQLRGGERGLDGFLQANKVKPLSGNEILNLRSSSRPTEPTDVVEARAHHAQAPFLRPRREANTALARLKLGWGAANTGISTSVDNSYPIDWSQFTGYPCNN